MQKQSLEQREQELAKQQAQIEQQLIQLNQAHAQIVGRRLELRRLMEENGQAEEVQPVFEEV